MEFDQLSNKIIGHAIEVHKETGPGLLESTYKLYRIRYNLYYAESLVIPNELH